MITVRRAGERGEADHGWLLARHTFSFADYHDPRWMGFRSLRVINEDRVQPGQGFGTHGHRDMEILTWVLEGELRHEDSMGNGSVIRPGEIQFMSAGTGVQHSEQNPSRERPVHLLQIWLLPERRGLRPGYEQRAFPEAARRGRLCTLAARAADGAAGATDPARPVAIHQDAALLTALLAPGEAVTHALQAGRAAWVQVARGSVSLRAGAGGPGRELTLHAGDGVAVEGEPQLHIAGAGADTGTSAASPAEILLFDLA